MASRYVNVVSIIIALACAAAILFACLQPWPEVSERCDPQDSKAICTAVKQCFDEHPASLCREYEHTEILLSKPNPALYDTGTAQGLNY